MDADRNLLFGVLALQADLIDSAQFVEACALWTTRKAVPLADLLVERGWILPSDREHVCYLLERKLQKSGRDVKASLESIPNDIKRSLAALDDADIRDSLVGPIPDGASQLAETIDSSACPPERYSLTRLHASGGIGRVWVARDIALGRDVALKELRPERANHPSIVARFLKEARITGQLEHPGIVPVYELSQHRGSGQSFYTMRFVKGRTLSEAIRAYHDKRRAGQTDSMEFLALLTAFVTVCNTIAYGHSRGVIHRDLKGQNVILGDFGEVVVLDWGLAKLVNRIDAEAEPFSESFMPEDSAEAALTVSGQVLGTPAYMAPEQAAGRTDLIDARTDVYGLGAILYELLCGLPPFSGSSTPDLLQKVRDMDPQPPGEVCPGVPPVLEASCLRALAKSPWQRHASAIDLSKEIQGWQEVQRRQVEELLRQSQALYHSLVEMLPLQVWRKDQTRRFTFGNKAFCDHLGVSVTELIGSTDFDLFPQELAEKYRADDLSVMTETTSLEADEDHVTSTGERLRVHVVKRPILGVNGDVVGIQGIFWDVTERERLQRALETMTAELAAVKQRLERV